jgi:hypothetical protein
MAGASSCPPAFLIGIEYGTHGMAYAWLAAFPILTR